MADKGFKSGFNGVSYGAIVTADATDVTDTYIEMRFSDDGCQYPLAFNIQCKDSSDINVALSDAVITTNEDVSGGVNGSIRIDNGASTFAITSGYVFNIIAQPAREV